MYIMQNVMEGPQTIFEKLERSICCMSGIYSTKVALGGSISSRNMSRPGQSAGCMFVIVP